MGKQRDLADGADVINFIDGLTSDVQEQLDTLDPLPSQSGQSGKYLTTDGTDASWGTVTTDPTLGTLTKTFTQGEASTINLTSSVLAPVVSVTKEVPQSGVTNNNWDVNSTSENYTRLNSAPATTLDFVAGNISEASYDSVSLNVLSQDTEPAGLTFNSDGTKMFVVGYRNDNINEYTLSSAYDLSTASYSQAFSVNSQEAGPTGIAFNTDGSKMFVSGASGDDVNEYTLSTGFDVSTASFVDSFSVSAQDGFPSDLAFNTSGTKMFVLGLNNRNVNQYTLSTAFDVSTASYSQNFSVSSQDTAPYGLAFNADGTKMFVSGDATNSIYQYNLSTGFDVSTAVYNSTLSVSSQSTLPWGIAFSADSTKMFIVNYSGDSVLQYSMDFSALELGTGSFASADVGKTIEANDGVFVLTATDGSIVETTAPTSYDQVASGSWEMYGVVYNAADGDLQLSGGLFNTFDVSTASYDSVSFAINAVSEGSMTFSPDGFHMYVVDYGTPEVDQYFLSTSFDLSSASYVRTLNVSAQITNGLGIAFSPDGVNMYISSYAGGIVARYSLSSAWNISTASYVSGDVSVISSPTGIAFNSDGTKMFVLGYSSGNVNEYSLSTAWNTSTASYVQNLTVQSSPYGITFNPDGTKMFIVWSSLDIVQEYSLSSAYNISTATSGSSFSVASQDAAPQGVAFSTNGTKMFVLGVSNDRVYQYSIGASYIPTGYQPVHTTSSIDTTYWTDINSMTADQAAGDGNIYYAISTDDRTTWTVIDNTDGERDIVRNNAGTWQYNSNGTYASETWVNGATNTELATLAEAMEGAVGGYHLANASYDSVSFNSSGQTILPIGLVFNNDGTKMFIADYSGQDINEYTLSSAFDITTASFVDSFNVSSQETQPLGMAFNTGGTKMFVVGLTGADVNEYTLSTGFDVSTASFVDSFSVSAQDTQPAGVKFNTDGTKMFVVGYTNDVVYEYNLSTGFDVSSASFVDSFSVSAQAVLPIDLAFNPEGTSMFIVDYTGQDVNEYSLSTAFDISSASFVRNFSVSSQDTQPRSVAFNENGSKMFLLGSTNYSVYQYSIGSFTNQMNKTQLDAVTDPNHIALGDDLDLAIVFNMTSGTTVPSSDGVAINYDANVLNKGAVLGTDYDFDAPAGDEARITALTAGNFKVRVV